MYMYIYGTLQTMCPEAISMIAFNVHVHVQYIHVHVVKEVASFRIHWVWHVKEHVLELQNT